MLAMYRWSAVAVVLALFAPEASAQTIALPQPVAGAQRGRVVLRASPRGRIHYRSHYGQGITDTFAGLVRDLVVIGVDQLNPKDSGTSEEPAAVLAKSQEAFAGEEAAFCEKNCETLKKLYAIRDALQMEKKELPACECVKKAEPLPPVGGGFEPVDTGAAPAGPAPKAGSLNPLQNP